MLSIENPKRRSDRGLSKGGWYPYHAGFSVKFANSVLDSASLPNGARVLDPWNGTGTTTTSAFWRGLKAVGCDLNPAMGVVAKARLLDPREILSILPIAVDILSKAARDKTELATQADPLTAWLCPESASSIRKIERALCKLLINPKNSKAGAGGYKLDALSTIAAFFYTGLFRTTRTILRAFFSTNPTWVKKPRDPKTRLRPSAETIADVFLSEIENMAALISNGTIATVQPRGNATILVASSSSLPVRSRSIDLVLSSPPYCTRIDYAVATSFELAVMGFKEDDRLHELRQQLMGTTAILANMPRASEAWGRTCLQLIQKIYRHPSKASKTYYYKNHLQYFAALNASLKELGRVLKPGGNCVLVAQDSYYKEIHIDLAKIVVEMAGAFGMELKQSANFVNPISFARVNPAVRKQRKEFEAIESVLCFLKSK